MPQGQLALDMVPSPGHLVSGQVARPQARVKRDTALQRDRIHVVERGGVVHLVAENYSYKSEAYYTILAREMEGQRVAPSTCAILDAFVVPICLERARLEGIPVAEYAISQSCTSAPAIIYGLNYFACTSHFEVLREDMPTKEVIRHVTNNGKYPFCSQRLGPGTRVERAISVFGRVDSCDPRMVDLASRVWACFRIPLVELVCLSGEDGLCLSSLCPVRYSHLRAGERDILTAYLHGQGFL